MRIRDCKLLLQQSLLPHEGMKEQFEDMEEKLVGSDSF